MHVETIAADAAIEARADVVLSGRELRDAVKLLASKAADKRSTIPILASIYFEIAPDGRATLTATDLTAWASLTLQALSDDVAPMPGAFALEGAALHKVLSKAGKAERIRLTVNTDATRVRLKTGRIEMHLRTVADEFPLAPIRAYRSEVAGELSRAQLMADLAALAPAMSTESHRQNLQGVALQMRDMAGRDCLTMAATDGFKLAAAARPIPAGCEAWADCIMPSRTVDLALAAHKLAGGGDALILSQGGGALEIAFGNVSIYSQCVDETFPDWPRAFDSIAAPTDEEQCALFPDLLPHYPAGRAADMEKAAPGAIDWQPGNGALIGASAADPGMVWAVMYLATGNAGLADPVPGFKYRTASEAVEVEVAGDRAYPVAVNANATRIHLSKEQIAALCGDSLWDVLEFPGADGKPRYVSQWLWDDGATRLLCVGKDGRCPKADAPREYVTRAEVEAALAGEIAATVMIEAPAPSTVAPQAVSAPEIAEERAEPVAMAADTAEAPASDPTPVSCQPADDSDPIAAVRARLAEIEAILATLPAQSARPKRTPAHERAIRRAWVERKAAREYRASFLKHRDARNAADDAAKGLAYDLDRAKAARDRMEAEALRVSDICRERDAQLAAAQDQARLAEHEARQALAAREDLKRILAATERRAEAAEAENAQLWAEIETLTAPVEALAA